MYAEGSMDEKEIEREEKRERKVMGEECLTDISWNVSEKNAQNNNVLNYLQSTSTTNPQIQRIGIIFKAANWNQEDKCCKKQQEQTEQISNAFI